jgi:hypothetical protein
MYYFCAQNSNDELEVPTCRPIVMQCGLSHRQYGIMSPPDTTSSKPLEEHFVVLYCLFIGIFCGKTFLKCSRNYHFHGLGLNEMAMATVCWQSAVKHVRF